MKKTPAKGRAKKTSVEGQMKKTPVEGQVKNRDPSSLQGRRPMTSTP